MYPSLPCQLGVLALALVASAASVGASQVVERVPCQRDPSQTYALFLPDGYATERQWPALLIFDPRGRATVALEIFRGAAERHGWILLSSYDTRSDGPPDPNTKAINAMWPELWLRYAIDPRRVYAAGFSGGAHLAWLLARQTGGLAGVVASGGRFIAEVLPERPTVAAFLSAGDEDFNFQGTREVDAWLAGQGAPHRLEIFSGPHQWMPPELADEAVLWLEVQAMRQGLRGKDDDLVARAYRADLAAAAELEGAGRLLDALRRYEATARSVSGLCSTAEVEQAARRLKAAPACATQEREEARWDTFESHFNARLGEVVGALRSAERPMTGGRILSELGVTALKQQADQSGSAGSTARRLLNKVFGQAATYLPPELLARQEIPQAIAALEVAVAIRPDDAGSWYNLACARSRGGQARAALEALTRAVDCGFKDKNLLETDPDLAAVRKIEGFAAVLQRVRGSVGGKREE